MADEEGHIDFLETQLDLISKLGLQLYAQHHIGDLDWLIPGWLSVERTARAARQGRNPQTGETIQIAASNGVKISAGSKLKAAAK